MLCGKCVIRFLLKGFLFHIMWSLILPQMFLSRSKTDSLMAHCSVKMINGVNQRKKLAPKHRWKPCRPKLIISWCSYRSTCVTSQTLHQHGGKNISEDESSLAVNLTAPPLSAISQTQPNILFSLSPPFLIASLLSNLESYYFFSFSYHPGRSMSQFQITNWRLGQKMSPMQPRTIIVSTWLCPSSALSIVKFPGSAHTLDPLQQFKLELWQRVHW